MLCHQPLGRGPNVTMGGDVLPISSVDLKCHQSVPPGYSAPTMGLRISLDTNKPLTDLLSWENLSATSQKHFLKLNPFKKGAGSRGTWACVCACASPAYLGRLEAHACPLGGGKVHGLRDAVAAAHFGHKGSGEADDELAALLHGPVHLDALFAQHLRGNLGSRSGLRHTLQDTLVATLPPPLPSRWGTPTPALQAGPRELRRGLFMRRQIRFGIEDFLFLI